MATDHIPMVIKATICLQKKGLFLVGYLNFQQSISRNRQFANSQNRLFSSFFSDFHFLTVPGGEGRSGRAGRIKTSYGMPD